MVIVNFLNGLAIIPCFLCKAPQIALLMRTWNTRGISFESILIEMFVYINVFGFSYFQSYPMLQYLEYPLLVVQNVLLLIVIAAISQRAWRSALWLIVFAAQFQLYNHISKHIALSIISMNSVIGLSGKVAQIKEIVSSENSDSVSYAAFILNGQASAARLFIIYLTGLGETVMVINFLVSVISNIGVMTTIYLYRSSSHIKQH